MAWLTGWNRRKSKIINGSAAGAQANYQMQLTVHKGTGTDTATDIYLGTNVRDDFGDMRFTSSNGSSLLNYWIESYTSGSISTFWIQIDSIPTTGTTIYVYYDNSSQTTTSNGTNTFQFFDDFSGDLSKWTITQSIPGNIQTISGQLRLYGDDANYNTNGVVSNTIISNNTVIEFKVNTASAGEYGYSVSPLNPNSNGIIFNSSTSGNLYRMRDGSQLQIGTYTQNVYNNYKIVVKSTGYSLYLNDVLKEDDTTWTNPNGANRVVLSQAHAQYSYIDDVRVRKYTSPEPTWSCSGGEEVSVVSWLSGWNRRKSKIVNGSTSGAQSNYQMKLTIHKSSGTDISTDIYLGTNVRDDFGDVRFTKQDGSSLLNYWIESISGTIATFWIQIDSIPASPCTSLIYIYYDNVSQTTISNGTNTFDAFDLTTFTLYDPNGDLTVVNSSKVSWTSKNLYTSTARLYKSISSRSDFALEYESHDDARQHYDVGFTDSVGTPLTVSNGIYARDTTPGGAIGTVIEHMTSGSALYSSGYTAQGTILCYNRFTRLGTSVILSMFSDAARTIHVSGSPVTYTDTLPVAVTYFYAITGIGSSSGGEAQSGYLQNFRVRKYSSPEPTFGSSGTEETPALITATAMIITTSQTPCLQGICTVTVEVTWTNQGTATGSFVPSLTIDGTPIVSPYPSEDLGAGASVTHAFDITNLAVGDRAICPSPN